MALFKDEIPEAEEEEAFEDLLKSIDKEALPNLTPTDEITVRVPNGMSIETFLKAIKDLSKSPEPRGEIYLKCDTCSHLDPSDGHCKMYSCVCATDIFNHRKPFWYSLKEEV